MNSDTTNTQVLSSGHIKSNDVADDLRIRLVVSKVDAVRVHVICANNHVASTWLSDDDSVCGACPIVCLNTVPLIWDSDRSSYVGSDVIVDDRGVVSSEQEDAAVRVRGQDVWSATCYANLVALPRVYEDSIVGIGNCDSTGCVKPDDVSFDDVVGSTASKEVDAARGVSADHICVGNVGSTKVVSG